MVTGAVGWGEGLKQAQTREQNGGITQIQGLQTLKWKKTFVGKEKTEVLGAWEV